MFKPVDVVVGSFDVTHSPQLWVCTVGSADDGSGTLSVLASVVASAVASVVTAAVTFVCLVDSVIAVAAVDGVETAAAMLSAGDFLQPKSVHAISSAKTLYIVRRAISISSKK